MLFLYNGDFVNINNDYGGYMARRRCNRRFESEEEDPMAGTAEVQEGQTLNETPDTSNQTGQGYTEMGKVYKDPSTGKLIMVQNSSS